MIAILDFFYRRQLTNGFREAPGALCRGVIEGLDLSAMVRSSRLWIGILSSSGVVVPSGIRLCDGSVFEPQALESGTYGDGLGDLNEMRIFIALAL